MTRRSGLYLESVIGTNVLPKEPVPPVIRMDALVSMSILSSSSTAASSRRSFGRQQGGRRAFCHDPTALELVQSIAVLDRREPMRDDDYGLHAVQRRHR